VSGLGSFLFFALLFFAMMRFGCGARVGHGGHGHEYSTLGMKRPAYREERQMIGQFGDQHLRYRERIPMFFPGAHRWRQFIERSQIAP
jgi:protein-S-isoprenylcysteine O-methyltransferase Ste14